MICLRPHHLLCIQKYTGHGYDGRFTEHMDRITRLLRSQPETLIRLREGCDELCSACPNRTGEQCRSEEKTAGLDLQTARLCGIKAGDELPWRELAARARNEILNTSGFAEVCEGCSWYGLCAETQTIDK